MSKSKNIKLQGTAFWARVYEGNHDEFGGKEFYKITVALTPESWSKYNQSGMGLKPKAVSSDDPTPGVTFRRDIHAKTGTDAAGKAWSIGGGAPKVTDADGSEFDELIGNGSEVEIVVNTYKVQNGPMKGKMGHRLESVRVLEHVPYEAPDDDDTPVQPEPAAEAPTPKKSSKGLPF